MQQRHPRSPPQQLAGKTSEPISWEGNSHEHVLQLNQHCPLTPPFPPMSFLPRPLSTRPAPHAAHLLYGCTGEGKEVPHAEDSLVGRQSQDIQPGCRALDEDVAQVLRGVHPQGGTQQDGSKPIPSLVQTQPPALC